MFSIQELILRLLLATIWVFKAMVVFLTLKQKSVLLVASLFDLKVDLVFLTHKNEFLGLELSMHGYRVLVRLYNVFWVFIQLVEIKLISHELTCEGPSVF